MRAILAGADVLLMPPDPEQAIRALVAAVENGRIPRQRIDDSAMRVLAAKIRVGLTRNKLVNVETVADVLEAKESGDSAQHVSDRAVTLLRNEGNIVPLADANHACVIIAVQSRASTSGPRFAQEFARRAKAAHIVTVDSTMPQSALEAEAGDTTKCSAIVVSADVAVAANRGDVALAGDLAPFIESSPKAPCRWCLLPWAIRTCWHRFRKSRPIWRPSASPPFGIFGR